MIQVSQSIGHTPPITVVHKTSNTVAPQTTGNIQKRQSHPETHIITSITSGNIEQETSNTIFILNFLYIISEYYTYLHTYIYIYIYKRLNWFVKQHQVHKTK